MTAQVFVEFDPHWVNGWFVRAVYRPWVRIDDGAPILASWRGSTAVDLPAGEHRVTTYLTWRGAGATRISERYVTAAVADEEVVRIRVRNGPLNQDPFVPRVVAEES